MATEGLGGGEEALPYGKLIDRSPEHCLDTSVLGAR